MNSKRLLILTVGKTHSGKTTFARKLEKRLPQSIVVDQDVHAEFLNHAYPKLVPVSGPNLVKHALTRLLADYIKHHTDLHVIVSNANLTKESRAELFDELYDAETFTRILVYFDLPKEVLLDRIHLANRSTDIMRGKLSTFTEVLEKQAASDAPTSDEADHLLQITHPDEVDKIIEKIIAMSK